jgi:hypothetical protein
MQVAAEFCVAVIIGELINEAVERAINELGDDFVCERRFRAAIARDDNHMLAISKGFTGGRNVNSFHFKHLSYYLWKLLFGFPVPI